MQQFVLYSRIDTNDTYLELWGSSTKHPDALFKFSDFQLSKWFSPHRQIFQWILECASKLSFPTHARALTDFAIEVWNALQEAQRLV